MILQFHDAPPAALQPTGVADDMEPSPIPFYPADLPVLTFTELDELQSFQRQYAYALAHRARITGEIIA